MTYTKNNTQNGFTLLEVLGVLLLIGILFAVLIPMITTRMEKARIKTVKLDLRNIQSAIDQFHMDTRVYPRTLKDLIVRPAEPKEVSEKWESAYLPGKDIPRDPWNNNYYYSPTQDGQNPYTLYSKGGKDKKKINLWSLD